jgi:uncharacterized protein YciI
MIARPLTLVGLALVLAASAAGNGNPVPPGAPAMANYQFGILRRGPAWTPVRTPVTDSIQAGHMANIRRMSEEGLLVAAGPLLDGGNLRGVFVFRDDSLVRLRALVARDPAVQSGRLVLDLYPWVAPAGIGEPYKRMAAKPGHRDSMVRYPLAILRAGPRAAEAAGVADSVRDAHARIIPALASGALASAGPFRDKGELKGVMVFRGDSAAAHRWALADPRVRAGDLAVEMLTWFAAWGTWPGDTLATPR